MASQPGFQSWNIAAVVWISAYVTIALGAAVLIGGWFLDIDRLRTVMPGLASMKVNTAVAFLLSGMSLWTAARRGVSDRDIIGRSLAAAVAAIGVLTLLEFLLGVDLRIDELLYPDRTISPGDIAGRMSAITALNFALFGIGRLVAGRSDRLSEVGFATVCMLGLLASFLALIGYAYGVPFLYRPLPTASIGLHTTIGFILLFVGLLATRPNVGIIDLLRSEGAGGTFVRWLLPAVVVILPSLGWLRLRGELAGLYDTRTGLALITIASVVILLGVLWSAGRFADRLDAARRQTLTSLTASARQLRENEEQLRQSNELANAIIQGSPLAIMVMDQRRVATIWNRAAEKTLGYSATEIVTGSPVSTRLSTEAFEDVMERVRAGEIVSGHPLRLQRKDGRVIDVLLSAAPMYDKGGTLRGVIAIYDDITERKAIEAQLAQAQKMETVGQLTGGLAHDFNNLLSIVIGNIDMLVERVARDAGSRELAESALSASLRGAELTRQLLGFSRRQTLQPKAIDVNGLVRAMTKLLQRTLGEQITIQLRTAPGLWAAHTDPAQLESALLNLAVNARDAMPKGGSLVIEAENASLDEDYARGHSEVRAGDYVMIAVTDTGSGMPPDVLARAFEPFFTTKEAGKGTGLGLSMVYGFAKQSSGHIKLYSEAGHGTTVKLYLPRSFEGVEAAAPAEAASGTRGGALTILVVEDNEDVRRTVVRQLKDLGYSVVTAQDGKSALDVLAGGAAVDLLFTDIVMPGKMTGFDLARAAQDKRPGLKVLFTSGFTEIRMQNSIGERNGKINLLSKPYRKNELARRISDVLGGPAK